jgi:hypothetical protein
MAASSSVSLAKQPWLGENLIDRPASSTDGKLEAAEEYFRWNNPLRGYGVGIAHLVSVRGQSAQTVNQQYVAAQQAAQQSHYHGS